MKNNNRSLTVYTDGACSGNPGKAGIGIAIYNEEGEKIKEISKSIGMATNNIAEYTALLFALQEGLFLGCREEITVYTDSELLCKQIKGEYKVKNDTLRVLFHIAQHLITGYKTFHIEHIRRELNKTADKLATASIK
ncbi:MAG: ribonuclease HI family protein [Candidatus Omnitrophica bacterium]|nr:ribonuclease HI family protein [Candidatus Omnitrophota bacterium]MBU1047107.1 ribonuclease HI family protein [Candidatus Omnitrophota bacterium]MBU1630529.1 ribonuclease HI family protein [Candidatus Omnitrophota bacterium]MBU1889011.1 ribonuclease HI family protein [Candidatus Omnitrophota bacterium]